jgi:ABC-2 type transport system ATP-binding protein
VVANNDITLTVARGEVFGLLGPNGAGKTTLVRQLAGVLRPHAGRVEVLGHDIGADPSLAPRLLAYLAQEEPALLELPVGLAVETTGRLRGLPRAAARDARDAVLDELGIGALAARPLSTLSGGQRRLAQVATVLVGDRPVLVLDEPTTGLDPEARRAVWGALTRRRQAHGATVVLVTHNVLEAEAVLDRVAVLDHGRLIACDTPGRLKALVSDEVRLDLVWRADPPYDDPTVAALAELAVVQRAPVERPAAAGTGARSPRPAHRRPGDGGARRLHPCDTLTRGRLPRARRPRQRPGAGMTTAQSWPAPLATAPGPFAALGAVYAGQLSRARAARGPLLFVATLQSLGILLLLRGVVDEDSAATSRQVVAGATVLVVAFVALNLLAQRFGMLRASRGLDHYAALPVAPSSVVLGTAASYATFTVPGAVLTAVIGSLLYGLPLAHLWVLLLVLPLAGASLAGLGALLGLLAPRPELATMAGQLGMSVVLFLGIIPADRLPDVLQPVRAVVPSTYAVDALAGALRPRLEVGPLLADLAVCVVVAVASLALAAAAFRRAVRQ